MDKKRSLLNVSVSILSHVILLIAGFLIRRLLIHYIGNDVNGLNSLYVSIIGVLSVAELGVGSAINYSMYKPIVEGDKIKVAALYRLYQKAYRIIGGVILAGGLLVMPFLPTLIKDYDGLNVNVYLNFGLVLLSVVLSYLYGAKTSLINAYKNNYLTTGITTVCHLIQYGLKAVVLIVFQSFPLFLACNIIGTLLVWGVTEDIARRQHKDILVIHAYVDRDTRKDISRNIRAMMIHKIGGVLVNTVDSVIISAFIGVVVLGKYSNYTQLIGMVTGIISLFFTPLVSVIGHLCAGGNKGEIKFYFERFYFLNYALGVVFFLGYYAVCDQIIRLFFGDGLELSRIIAFVITLNRFVQFMRHATLLFRNATGTFYYDRWKPIAEGISNLILSLLFVCIFPEELKVVGVIVATIITNLMICDIVEPYVVFKHVFKESAKRFCLRNYLLIGLFVGGLFGLNYVLQPERDIFINGMISVAVSLLLLGLVLLVDRNFRREIRGLWRDAVRMGQRWIKRSR